MAKIVSETEIRMMTEVKGKILQVKKYMWKCIVDQRWSNNPYLVISEVLMSMPHHQEPLLQSDRIWLVLASVEGSMGVVDWLSNFRTILAICVCWVTKCSDDGINMEQPRGDVAVSIANENENLWKQTISNQGK
jgi:hypothetical protein